MREEFDPRMDKAYVCPNCGRESGPAPDGGRPVCGACGWAMLPKAEGPQDLPSGWQALI